VQNGHSQSLNSTNRNSLLSDLSEMMPCLMRQESATLNLDFEIPKHLYAKDFLNSQFILNYVNKLSKEAYGDVVASKLLKLLTN
jgi:hypothetical protein